MRTLADENISNLVIGALRAHGHDVVSVAHSFPGATDEVVMQSAHAPNRILITEDRDFGELVIRQRRPIMGVVLRELDRLSTIDEAARVSAVNGPSDGSLIARTFLNHAANLPFPATQ